ncbi:type II secretion system F family protein [Staphylospora marina]|uniref:type II secretion system F family protein n=1 Tax=Staphylospora marina TaxID=2490858 RepID=UPI000F5BDDFC|nr:type II secretion system F family protein [Staphylospora marina]
MIALLGAAAVFCLMLALYHWIIYTREKAQTAEVLERYVGSRSETRWSDRLADRLDRQRWARRLEPKLLRASIRLRPSEYGVLLVGAGVVILLFMNAGLGAPFGISLLVAVILVPFGSKMLMESRKFLYARKVDAQLSEVCRLMSSAARAGLSVPQALELVHNEMDGPIKEELGVVVRELRLGRNLDASLNEMLRRVNTRDLKVFANALIIQRKAGGDLARVLSEMAGTMEERKIINKTIDATIAQARYTAYLLPVLSLLIIFLMSRMIDGFFDFFTTLFGMITLAVFVLLQIIGFLVIRRIADIKI